jgi:hypothetical protein
VPASPVHNAASAPPISKDPCSGTRKPERVIANVDLPAPLGPTTAMRPPPGTLNETSCSVAAGALGHRTVTPRSSTTFAEDASEPLVG